MSNMKSGIRRQWDIKGLVKDLRGQPWRITEGPTPGGSVRIDRMSFLASYGNIESLAKDLLPKQEIEEAEREDTLPEVLDDAAQEYIEALAELVAEEMGQHVYGTFEEGDAFVGQYEEGGFPELAKGFDIDLDRPDIERLRRVGLQAEGR